MRTSNELFMKETQLTRAGSKNPGKMTFPAQENRDYSLSRGNSETLKALGAAPGGGYHSTEPTAGSAQLHPLLAARTWNLEAAEGSECSHKKSFPMGNHSWERAALMSLQLINDVISSHQPGASPLCHSHPSDPVWCPLSLPWGPDPSWRLLGTFINIIKVCFG